MPGWYDVSSRSIVEQEDEAGIKESSAIVKQLCEEQEVLPPDELKAATALVYSTLDEKQRRLCAGLESLRLGYGGDRKIANLLRMNVHTVAKGRKELLLEDLDLERIRKPGGGRKSIKKKRPR